jgi:GntR family transcriptional regulator
MTAFLTIDAADPRPLYRQVVDGIKALIARGSLRQGMAVPSVRQVAGDLGVNLNTIASAYRELEREGFLNVRHGAGTVVAQRRPREGDESQVRKPLRTALMELVLAGRSDREIVGVVRQELETLRQRGNRP